MFFCMCSSSRGIVFWGWGGLPSRVQNSKGHWVAVATAAWLPASRSWLNSEHGHANAMLPPCSKLRQGGGQPSLAMAQMLQQRSAACLPPQQIGGSRCLQMHASAELRAQVGEGARRQCPGSWAPMLRHWVAVFCAVAVSGTCFKMVNSQ